MMLPTVGRLPGVPMKPRLNTPRPTVKLAMPPREPVSSNADPMVAVIKKRRPRRPLSCSSSQRNPDSDIISPAAPRRNSLKVRPSAANRVRPA